MLSAAAQATHQSSRTMTSTTEERYSMYMPFYTDFGGGAETRIEQVQVNKDDLHLLNKQLQMMSTQKVLAFFGKRRPVLAAVNEVIGENIPSDRLPKKKRNCIYVAIKDQWVAIFAIIAKKFFENRELDKESIVITLFRYLQDFSATVLLCIDDGMVRNFAASKKNPFANVAHKEHHYVMVTQKHLELKESKVETHYKQLERDLDFKLQMLVLNENGSRFFLDQKYEAKQEAELKIRGNKLVQELKTKYYLKVSKTHVEGLIANHQLVLTSDSLNAVVHAHNIYVTELCNGESHLSTKLSQSLQQIFSNLRGDKLYMKAYAYFFQGKDLKTHAEWLARYIIDNLVARSSGAQANNDNKSLYVCCLDQIKRIFEIQTQDVNDKISRLFTQSNFRNMLNETQIQTSVHDLENSVSTILIGNDRSVKRPTLQLNVCAIHTQKSADGTCSGFIIAPYKQPITVKSEQLEDYYFRGSDKKRSPNSDEVPVTRQVSVKAIFPLRGDQSFLLLFDNGNKSQTLVAISSLGSQSVLTRWSMDDFIILPYKSASLNSSSLRFVLILTECEKPSFNVFEVNDAIKYVLKSGEYIKGSIRGKIVSAASFPLQEKVLLLTDKGGLYEIELKENTSTAALTATAARELIIRHSIERAVARPRETTNWSDYREVMSIQNDKFFIMRSTSKVDIFNWNFELQLSLQVQAGSAVKVFSDDKNVYLVAFSHGKITSHVFPDLSADVTLREQSEESVEKEKGNPIIDVIYATYVKYGPNSTFIGAPAQIQYVVALKEINENFNNKLQQYLGTFSRPFQVKTETLQKIRFDCEPQAANRNLPAIMSSRTPVHICTIEANNLVPLVDDNRVLVAGRATSISNAAECMSFAHLESVVQKFCADADHSVRVVSIIGKTSSGKSYLLNQLFGTRFSVAATRCTDGIWMSYARILTRDDTEASVEVEQSFLVLDCEGLFSINRSEQEEIKLLLVLAAISDVTILNRDLDFDRNIERLFADLNNAIGKLKGSNYFHGVLMVAVRDVSSTDGKAAGHAFEHDIRSISSKGQQFLIRLFNSSMFLHCLNHFESPLFVDEVVNIRSKVVNKFKSANSPPAAATRVDGLAVLKSLKVVLQQVHNDDDQSADEHHKQLELNEIYNSVTAAWGKIDKVGSKAEVSFKVSVTTGIPISESADVAEEQTVEIAQNCVQFEYAVSENDCSFDKIKAALEKRFFPLNANQPAKRGYNQRWMAFNAFLQEFVRRRAQLLEEYAQEQVQKLGRLYFMKEEEQSNAIIGLKEKIRSFTINHGLCLAQCALCYLKCLQRKGHKESLEPQKELIQKQLTALRVAHPEEKPQKIEDLSQQSSAAKDKLQEKQQKLSEVEEQLKLDEENFQEAERFVKLTQKLDEIDLQLSEKRNELNAKSRRIGEIDMSKSLLDFFAEFVQQFQLLREYCDYLRDSFPRPTEVHDGATPSAPRDEKQEEKRTTCWLIEASNALAVAVLHEDVRKVLEPLACDSAHQSNSDSDELATKKLSELCLNLQAFNESVSNLASQSAACEAAIMREEDQVAKLSEENESNKRTLADLEQECKRLTLQRTEIEKDLAEKKQTKVEVEAELDEKQQQYRTKEANLKDLEQQLFSWTANYQSLTLLQEHHSELTTQVNYLTAVKDAAETELTLQLSSEEEAKQVAESMLEYFTRYETEKWHETSPAKVQADSAEWVVVAGDDEAEQKSQAILVASLIEKSLWSASHNYTEFSCKFAQLRKLKDEKENVTVKLHKTNKRLLSYKEDLDRVVKEKAKAFLLAKIKSLQDKNVLCEIQLKKVNKSISTVENCEIFQRCQRQLELHDRLSADYPLQFNNEQLREIALTVVRLKQNAEKCEEATEALTEESSVTTHHDEAWNQPGDVEASETQKNSKLQALHNMLWDKVAQKNRQEALTEISQLKQRQDEVERVLVTWPDAEKGCDQLKSEIENLASLRSELELKLQDAVIAVGTLQSYNDRLVVELQQNGQAREEAKTNVLIKENELNAIFRQLQDEGPKVLEFAHTARRLDETVKKLKNQADSRRELEETSKLAASLQLEITALKIERESAQNDKSKCDEKAFAPAAEYEDKLKSQRADFESLSAEVQNLQDTLNYQQEYIRLHTDQETLDRAIRTSCMCSCTNHECDQQCSICPNDAQRKCKHKAGHDAPDLLQQGLAGPEKHCCDKPKHDCLQKCHLCESQCVYPLGHDNPANHLCASSHQCEQLCEYCINPCKGNLAQMHTTHVCTQVKCPKPCILCGNTCSGQHDHDVTAPLVDVDMCFGEELPASLKHQVTVDEKDGKRKVKMHLCENAHNCNKRCEKEGICKSYYMLEQREWSQFGCSSYYSYKKPVMKTRRCKIEKASGSAWHEELHGCTTPHTCADACPECGSFCNEPVGHGGLHKSSNHRNMEHCYCVTKTEGETVTVSVQDNSGGKQARVYQAGDALTPEDCVHHCKRKGRAHYHLRPCPGEANCGEKKYSWGVQHCNESFRPHVDKKYDKYLCASFWSSINWQPPLDEPAIQLCNFYCPHTQHKSEPDKHKFCTASAWHTQSTLAADHTFECGHDSFLPVFNGLDVCFVIDSTNSMKEYFPKSAESIKRIMTSVVPQLAAYGKDTSCLRFAVVAYWDHNLTRVVDSVGFCSDIEAVRFLDSLKAAYGDDDSEAVLDGLDTAASLSWRADCVKLLIHICDAPPHGRQFSTGKNYLLNYFRDNYPDGCPCKRNEIDVLNKLKSKSIKYYVIPLTSHVNQMIDIFKQHIPVIRKELSDNVDLSSLIPAIVSTEIQDPELSALLE